MTTHIEIIVSHTGKYYENRERIKEAFTKDSWECCEDRLGRIIISKDIPQDEMMPYIVNESQARFRDYFRKIYMQYFFPYSQSIFFPCTPTTIDLKRYTMHFNDVEASITWYK